MRMRISRPRREFGNEGISFIERDAGESNMEIKVTKTGYFTKKKVLKYWNLKYVIALVAKFSVKLGLLD